MALPEGAKRQVERAHALMQVAGQGGQAPTPEPDPNDQPQPQPSDLEAQLENLRTEVRRLNGAIRTGREKSDREIERLQAEVERVTKERDELKVSATRKYEAGEITGLGEEERNLAGPMLPVFAKVAREVAAGEVAERFKPVQEQLVNYERQHEATYYATLDYLIPGWNASDGTGLNDDPKFYEWLDQRDPSTQRTRLSMLNDAQRSRQGFVVVEIIKAYREGREIGQSAPAKPQKQPRVDPAEAGGTRPPVNPEPKGRVWTNAEIAEFYRTRRTDPQYRGTEGQQRARQVELDIFAAQKEGRVKPG